jgi:hypothetical protein
MRSKADIATGELNLPDYTRLLKRHRDAVGKVIFDCPRLPHAAHDLSLTRGLDRAIAC